MHWKRICFHLLLKIKENLKVFELPEIFFFNMNFSPLCNPEPSRNRGSFGLCRVCNGHMLILCLVTKTAGEVPHSPASDRCLGPFLHFVVKHYDNKCKHLNGEGISELNCSSRQKSDLMKRQRSDWKYRLSN